MMQTTVMFEALRAVSHQLQLVRVFQIHASMEAFVLWMTRGIHTGELVSATAAAATTTTTTLERRSGVYLLHVVPYHISCVAVV